MKFHSEYFKDFRMLPDGFLSLRSRSMKGERHRCPSPTARFSTKCNITSVVVYKGEEDNTKATEAS